MRSADATPPSRRARPHRTATFRIRTTVILLLIALLLPALPVSRLTGAQAEPPPNPATGVAAGSMADTPPSPVSNGEGVGPTVIPATEPVGEPTSTLGATLPAPTGDPTGDPTIGTGPDPGESPSPPATVMPATGVASATTATSEQPVITTEASPAGTDDLVVSAAETGLPVVCQLVLVVTAQPPAPGATVTDPVADPVAGATFTVAIAGGGSITMTSSAGGVVNLYAEALTTSGLSAAAGDEITVVQTATRAGLGLGEPVFATTFVWQPGFAASCRVERFVVNPAIRSPSSPASATPSPSSPPPATPSPSPSTPGSPSPSPSPSASPSPTPSASPSEPVATASPAIPAGFGQIEVWTVARVASGAPAGQAPVRLPGGQFRIVARIDGAIVATMTTGADGTVQSPLLALGTYDLLLDVPPTGYLRQEARAVMIASPVLQRVVFELDPDPNALPASPPPGSPRASARPSASPATTATASPRPRTRPPGPTGTPPTTASPTTASPTTAPTVTTTPGRTRPRSTAVTTQPATATATGAPATSTPARPRTRTTTGTAPATQTATPRPVGTAATATPTRAATATRASTATPTQVVTPTSTPGVTATPTRPPRPTATVQGPPTRVTQLEDARITVEVWICIDPRFTNTGEFGSATDTGPRFLTDIDRSRCRPARSDETRITLTSTYPTYLPAYRQTTGSDASGRITFVFPAMREDRIGTLHLEGPIRAEDAGVRIFSGRELVLPLTIVVPEP